jgi:hypothetical protein
MTGLHVDFHQCAGSAANFAHFHLSLVGGELMKNESIFVHFGLVQCWSSLFQAAWAFQSCFDLILECSILFLQDHAILSSVVM